MEHDALPVPTRDKMFHRYVIELAAKLLQVQRNLSTRKRVSPTTLFIFDDCVIFFFMIPL